MKYLNHFILNSNILLKSSRTFQHVRSFSSPPKKSIPDKEGPNSPLGMMDRVPRKNEGKLDSQSSACSPPYPPFPDGKNPTTGELNGPSGPEPTRYGDWERKGRVSDF